MARRFASGSSTPASAARKRSAASTTRRRWPKRPRNACADARRLVGAQHAVVDEHAGEPPADGAIDDGGRHGGIDAAGERADDARLPQLGPDALDLLVDEVLHRPRRRGVADAEEEVAVDGRALIGVCDLGVELDAEAAARPVTKGGHRRVRARGQDLEPGGNGLDAVAVAHPDGEPVGADVEPGEEVAGVADLHARVAELPVRRARHPAARLQREDAHTVADAEHRHAELEDGGIG